MRREPPGNRLTKLLRVLERLFDAGLVARVFEPLLSDWQREWLEARTSGSRRRVVLSGAWAFALTLALCATKQLVTSPPLGATAWALAAFFAAVFFSPFLVYGVVLSSFRSIPTAGWDLWFLPALLGAAASAIPVAMLPFLFVLRSGTRVTGWHAIQSVALGLLLYCSGSLGSALLHATPPSAAQQESMELRAEANDRAGKYDYPASAHRQLNPTTPEERAKRLEARESRIEAISARLRARAIGNFLSIRTGQAVALIIAIGISGWLLGAIGPVTPIRVYGWWTLTWLAVYTLGAPLRALMPPGELRELAAWAPAVVFTGVAIALCAATTSRRECAPTAR